MSVPFDRPLTWVIMWCGIVLTYVLWILLTTNRPWHQRFHVQRNVNMAMKCKHCERAWLNRRW